MFNNSINYLSTVKWVIGVEREFKWKRDVDPMPGWELTQGWMSDEGFPDKGVLQLTYFSGNGSGEKECAPTRGSSH